MTGLPMIDEARLRALVPIGAAIDALEAALLNGSAPGVTPARTAVGTDTGQVLLMPAVSPRYVGVKLVTIAPDNPARGLPRIQGVYVLLDAVTLAPLCLIDGVGLTSLRTPAVSAVAIRRLAVEGPVRLVVVGTGPQGRGHVEAVAAVRQVEALTVAGREQAKTQEFEAAIRAADVVVCATTSRRPVFDSTWLRPDAAVVAVGSHEPDAREVDSGLVRQAVVVVETRESALREAGDVIMPIRAGEVGPDVVAGDLAELVRGDVTVIPGTPRFFKSVGEAWEDLVVASAAYDRLHGAGSDPGPAS